MDRIIHYTVSENETGLNIRQFLSGRRYSRQNLIELKKFPGGLTVNGHPQFINQPLMDGDLLTVHIHEESSSEKISPEPLPLNIVYEDEDMLVINKPAGMPIHPSVNNYGNTLANALAYYFEQQNKSFVFRCVNRLDKDTSGLTVIAKHAISAGILSEAVSAREIQREYLAIASGNVFPSVGTINAPIARAEHSIIERCVDPVRGEPAVTHYRVLDIKNGHSLLSLHLETGRTHQIRVHMKYLGFPLIGDYLYHPDMRLIKRQALHSHRLSFLHPITGKPLTFTAPLPEDMRLFHFEQTVDHS